MARWTENLYEGPVERRFSFDHPTFPFLIILTVMSDGRYPPQHGHSSNSGAHQDGYHLNGYTSHGSTSPGSTRSPRPGMTYGHAPHSTRQDAPSTHHGGYSSGYSHQGRPMSPNAHAQLAYAQHTPRPRSSSISMTQNPSQNYALQPPRSSTPSIHAHHHRSHSQAQVSLHNAAMRNHAASAFPHGHVQPPSSPPPSSHAYAQSSLSSSQYPASPSRPFPCDMCALSFNRQHDLKRHKETHSGERPYTCNGGCGKTFTRKDALKRHQVSIFGHV